MQVFEGAIAPKIADAFGAQFKQASVTVGNFDGLHLGHQALLKATTAHPGPKIVLTFDPHPLQVLQPERELKRLLPRQDLAEQLPRWQIDFLWILPFTRTFAALEPPDFLEAYLGLPFNPRHVVIGYDFAFGHRRAGSPEVISAWAEGRGATIERVAPLKIEGEVVSSRRLRELVGAGQVGEVNRRLGRAFYLRGEVVRGAGRGRPLGFPTLNQRVVNETLPGPGVYASRVRRQGHVLPSITNVGVNPTFGGELLKVETHVLDHDIDAYGEMLDVELLKRLRPEMKFSDADDLKKRIGADILEARAVHREAMDFDQPKN